MDIVSGELHCRNPGIIRLASDIQPGSELKRLNGPQVSASIGPSISISKVCTKDVVVGPDDEKVAIVRGPFHTSVYSHVSHKEAVDDVDVATGPDEVAASNDAKPLQEDEE